MECAKTYIPAEFGNDPSYEQFNQIKAKIERGASTVPSFCVPTGFKNLPSIREDLRQFRGMLMDQGFKSLDPRWEALETNLPKKRKAVI